MASEDSSSDNSVTPRLADEDDIRGDLYNPVVSMQVELQTVLDRHPGILAANPEYVATLLMDLGDTIRDIYDLDHEVSTYQNDICLVEIEDLGAVIGAPRTEPHGDVDQEALNDLINEGGNPAESETSAEKGGSE